MRLAFSLLLVALFGATSGCTHDLADDDDLEDDDELAFEQSAALTRPSVKAISHNIAGGMISKGAPAAIDYVEAQTRAWDPDVVMLQEVCESQFESFKTRFPTWNVKFAPMLAAKDYSSCRGGALGNVLASKWRMSDVTATGLGTAFDRKFNLLCADIAKSGVRAGGLRACVTHLRAWSDDEAEPMRTRQTAKIRQTLLERITKRKQLVVVGGDFNAVPHSKPLNNVYHQKLNGKFNGPGLFREADQTDKSFFKNAPRSVECSPGHCRTGQPTFAKRKLDYIFFSRSCAGGALSGGVLGTGTSDHNLYRGRAELTCP